MENHYFQRMDDYNDKVRMENWQCVSTSYHEEESSEDDNDMINCNSRGMLFRSSKPLAGGGGIGCTIPICGAFNCVAIC